MKRKSMKLLSVLMALLLLVGVLPVSALAADGSEPVLTAEGTEPATGEDTRTVILDALAYMDAPTPGDTVAAVYAGVHADLDANYRFAAGMSYEIQDSQWRTLEASSVLEAGKHYAFELKVLAQSGFKLDSQFSKCRVNISGTEYPAENVNLNPDSDRLIVMFDYRMPDSSADLVTITYDANGGTPGAGYVDRYSVPRGYEARVNPVAEDYLAPPAGMTFDALEVDGVRMEVGQTFTINTDVTIKVLWKTAAADLVTITYDANGGTPGAGYVDRYSVPRGYEARVNPVAEDYLAPPAGMTFDALEVDGVRMEVGQTFTINTDVTIKVLWKTAAPPPVLPGLDYTVSNGEATITGGRCDGVFLNIVDVIDGFPVVAIADGAFAGNTDVIQVDIGANVRSIGSRAFADCSNMELIRYLGNPPAIAADAFLHVTADSIYNALNTNWTDDLQQNYGGTLHWGEYQNDPKITYRVENNLAVITGSKYDAAFLVVPQICDGYVVAGIDAGAFAGMQTLELLIFESDIEFIGSRAFADCGSLQNIVFYGNAPVIADDAFQNVTALCEYSADMAGWETAIAQQYGGNLTWKTLWNPVEGWYEYAGEWYYIVNGEPLTDCWVMDSQGWCYMDSNGRMAHDTWQQDSKGWCYLDSTGHVLTSSWKQDSHGWVYLDSEGRMARNVWIMDSQGWCYLGDDGYMLKDTWQLDSKGWCYLDSTGHIVTNTWKQDSHGWVYLDGDGRMARNVWIMDSQGWCYLGDDGYMLKDTWQLDSKGWCYLDSTGHIVTNTWKQDSHGWVYLDGDGRMVRNTWVQDSSGWVWIGSDGYAT